MIFKRKILELYNMQTSVNYFSFVMEITEVNFSIFYYLLITIKNHQRKAEMKPRLMVTASKYMHQIASAMKALKKIQSYVNKISSLTSGHHYSFQYNIPSYCLAALFASP